MPLDPRRYRKVLLMVAELHLRGYQRIRISPGLNASGTSWRCNVVPISLMLKSNGAVMNWQLGLEHEEQWAKYSSAMEANYFDLVTTPATTPSGLARRFIEKYPNIVELGRGSDWRYAGWYVEMLHLTYPNAFPIAYADFPLPRGYLTTDVLGEGPKVQVPLPPPGEAPDPV
jgi:hypothetical protein